MYKKCSYLLLLLFFVSCSFQKGNGPSQWTYLVKDQNNTFLGYIVSFSNGIFTLASSEGYLFRIYLDGSFYGNTLYTADNTLNNTDIYVPTGGDYFSDSVYIIFTEESSEKKIFRYIFDNKILFLPYDKDFYQWSYNYKIGYYAPQKVSPDIKVIKLELSSSQEVGVPTNIKGPLEVFDRDGNKINQRHLEFINYSF